MVGGAKILAQQCDPESSLQPQIVLLQNHWGGEGGELSLDRGQGSQPALRKGLLLGCFDFLALFPLHSPSGINRVLLKNAILKPAMKEILVLTMECTVVIKRIS